MPSRPPRYRPTFKHPPASEAARPDATQRGYDRRWRKARLSFLVDHPLCASCSAKGLTVEATVVDHSIPHKGDQELFWRSELWVPLCTHCHNVKTATKDGAFGRAVVSKTNDRG